MPNHYDDILQRLLPEALEPPAVQFPNMATITLTGTLAGPTEYMLANGSTISVFWSDAVISHAISTW